MTKINKKPKISTPITNLTSTRAISPAIDINKKLKKVRVNIKKIKKSKGASNPILIRNNDQVMRTKTCFVKLRRITIDNSSFHNKQNALQVQCKVNKDKNLNKDMFNRMRKNLTDRKTNTKVAEINKSSAITKFETKISNENISQKRCPIKSKLNRKVEPYEVKKTTRKCVVKLANTQFSLKTESPLGPLTARCEIRLKKSPAKMKTNHATPSITKDCVILLGSPISLGDYKDHESVSTKQVIDQNKRHNLRKLNLKNSSSNSKNKEYEVKSNTNFGSKTKKNEQSPEATTQPNDNNSKENLFVNPLKVHKSVNKRFKLSLTSKNKENKSKTNCEAIQFGPQVNSTLHFEPVNNSTLVQSSVSKELTTEMPHETPRKTNSCKNKSSSQNLANKSEEIEKLLSSIDDEDDEILLNSPYKTNVNSIFKQAGKQTNDKLKTITSPLNNKTNKFFHRNEESIQGNILKATVKSKNNFPIKTQQVSKNNRVLKKRSSMNKRENVYDFLSQSQTSDSDGATKKHADPAADIIKKLIDEGKVRVATNCKGKGKPKLKRPPKQIKKTAEKKLKQLKNNKKKPTVTQDKENKSDCDDVYDEKEAEHFVDDFDNEQLILDVEDNVSNPKVTVPKVPTHSKNLTNDQEGTFSRLAKTVLINETGRSDLKRKNASLLLEMVKKYVSTPKNKKTPTTSAFLETNLSPIAMPPPMPSPKSSPWRVNEDAYLPKTFNFNRSSLNLPSFSSDYIPATPRKKKTNINIQQTTQDFKLPSVRDNQSLVNDTPIHQSLKYNSAERIQSPHVNEPSDISSFSSNDSNAENMPPSKPISDTNNQNDNIFDLKQLPNPRRTLNNRSPLKAINILEVVHLPPYKNPNKSINYKISAEEPVEILNDGDHSVLDVNVKRQQIVTKIAKNHPKEDLFGFEDFLSQSEFSSQELEESNNDDTTTNAQNRTIHHKLQNLRKLKPSNHELQISFQKENNINPLKATPLFNDGTAHVDGMRQRDLKEMLCSTMINPQPSTSKEALQQLRSRNLENSNHSNFGNHLDLSVLFTDPEPETTFNENEVHRTYIQPYKRKRRLKENKYVMFLDSDESENEQEDSAKQQKHQHSRETDTSSEKSPAKKRQHRKPKDKPELTEFVEEFNKMCKEVESYELAIEKSA